jgi:hypothetical protein
MGGRRDGMHYRTSKARSGERTSRSAHAARDAAYRAALGLGDDKPLPSELGSTHHQRGEFGPDYLA